MNSTARIFLRPISSPHQNELDPRAKRWANEFAIYIVKERLFALIPIFFRRFYSESWSYTNLNDLRVHFRGDEGVAIRLSGFFRELSSIEHKLGIESLKKIKGFLFERVIYHIISPRQRTVMTNVGLYINGNLLRHRNGRKEIDVAYWLSGFSPKVKGEFYEIKSSPEGFGDEDLEFLCLLKRSLPHGECVVGGVTSYSRKSKRAIAVQLQNLFEDDGLCLLWLEDYPKLTNAVPDCRL